MRLAGLAALVLLAACGEGGGSGEISSDLPPPEDAGLSLDATAVTDDEAAIRDDEVAPATAPRRLVYIGFDGPDFDACGSIGEVTGLNPSGDNFLAVRARPDAGAEELDRLNPGDAVWMCDEADNGWHGIVYERGTTGAGDCGVASPVDGEQPYAGGCASGWVSPRYLRLIAG